MQLINFAVHFMAAGVWEQFVFRKSVKVLLKKLVFIST